MQDPSRTERAPLREVTVERLREAIVSGDLEPASRLRENDLAERMQISRTPLREALRQLEAEGLVERTPAVGVFVAPMNADDADDVYQVKGALQVLAVDLACKRINDRELAELRFVVGEMQAAIDRADHTYYADLVDRFHRLLLSSARSPALADLYRALDSRIRRYRRFVLAQPGREADSLEEHLAIASALLARDQSAAKASMRAHAASARAFIGASIKHSASPASGTRQRPGDLAADERQGQTFVQAGESLAIVQDSPRPGDDSPP